MIDLVRVDLPEFDKVPVGIPSGLDEFEIGAPSKFVGQTQVVGNRIDLQELNGLVMDNQQYLGSMMLDGSVKIVAERDHILIPGSLRPIDLVLAQLVAYSRVTNQGSDIPDLSIIKFSVNAGVFRNTLPWHYDGTRHDPNQQLLLTTLAGFTTRFVNDQETQNALNCRPELEGNNNPPGSDNGVVIDESLVWNAPLGYFTRFDKHAIHSRLALPDGYLRTSTRVGYTHF